VRVAVVANEVKELAKQTTNGSSQVLAAAKSLSELASQLDKMVNNIKDLLKI
jgi:methyl-accepting chemotaxis protein